MWYYYYKLVITSTLADAKTMCYIHHSAFTFSTRYILTVISCLQD